MLYEYCSTHIGIIGVTILLSIMILVSITILATILAE